MSNIAVRAHNISKLYQLGRALNPNDTLRDAVQGAISRLRKGTGSNPNELLWALKDVSFDIQHGEVFGLIGLNGAGKSTLLKILSRITRPTTGRVEIHGRVGSLLEVGTGFHPDLTGRENIFLNGAILGMKKKEIEHKFDEIVAFSEMERFLDTQVKRYSSGMYVRLAFAVAAHLEPEVLLVDEVLAVGDAAFQKKCFGKVSDVAQSGRTVVLVSHNMAAVELLCSKGIVLKSGKIVYNGKADEAVRYYEEVIVTDARKENEALPGHILYQKPDKDPRKNFEITRIELLTLDGQPKERLYTWDPVRLRFHYYTSQQIASGAVEVRISTRHGVPLVYTSNQPDDFVPMSFSARESFTDLIIDQFPLSAGDYIIGAGLSIPNREWLCWNDALGVFTVDSRDVFKSGSAPVASRTLLAVPHQWESVDIPTP